jgi:hypothetical protein
LIPAKVIIGGREIKIEVRDKTEKLLNHDQTCSWGMSNFSEGIIYLENIPDKYLMEEILMHEIKHFIDFVSGRMKYFNRTEKPDLEVDTNLTDNVWWQFLKDNTNFFDDKNKKEK